MSESISDAAAERMPTMYITHGGGPCFFMDWDPPDAWDGLRAALEGIDASLPHPPSAVLVVTAHWETPDIAIESGEQPPLIYDYGGFPAHTYQLTYPAPGAPELARRAAELLEQAGIAHHLERRGWDHGVFVPLKVMYPEARIPVLAMSVRQDLDPVAHLELGRALAPLRDQGVLMVGSGSSFHNFSTFGSPRAIEFDDWLNQVVSLGDGERRAALADWTSAPAARVAHAREEHLIPLMVVAGAADDVPATAFFRGELMDTPLSCLRFD
jgi:aromatic ring-opening dioxygenase catalytic subunit (LigB family)